MLPYALGPLLYLSRPIKSKEPIMKSCLRLCVVLSVLTSLAFSQTNTPNNPSWWQKYQFLSNQGADKSSGAGSSFSVGPNVDVSNECGPQSETFIAINSSRSKNLAGGANEIFRLPMRGFFSSDG